MKILGAGTAREQDLHADPHNTNELPGRQAHALLESLRRWGVVDPLIARRADGRVYGGNHRLEAIRRLIREGHATPEIPVVWLDATDAEGAKVSIALNRIHGALNREKLRDALRAMLGADETPDTLQAIGINADTLGRLGLADAGSWHTPAPADAPKGGAVARADALAWLRGQPSRSAHVVLTDPPYGTGSAPWATGIDVAAFARETRRVLVRSGLAIVFTQEPLRSRWMLAAHDAGLAYRYEVVWLKKPGFTANLQKPCARHETIIAHTPEGEARPPWRGSRRPDAARRFGTRAKASTSQPSMRHSNRTTLLTTPGDGTAAESVIYAVPERSTTRHPARKPIGLVTTLLGWHLDPAQARETRVIDPYAGTGALLVAAKAYGCQVGGCDQDEALVQTANALLAKTGQGAYAATPARRREVSVLCAEPYASEGRNGDEGLEA